MFHQQCLSRPKCFKNNQPPTSFATKRFLNHHIRRVHGPHSFKCQVCFKTFHQPSSYREHQLTHSKQNNVGDSVEHKCSLCSRICSRKADLQKHMFHVHKKKLERASNFKCELCASEFASRSYLEKHVIRKHVVDKAFECPVCSKTFIDQETLDKHIPRHDNKIKHFCDLCSTGFKCKISLIRHLKAEHLKFFYCYKCLRSFGNKSEFDQHSNPSTPSGLELKLEFKCQICSESFDSQCHLDTHTNCHLKEINSPSTDVIKNPKNSKTTINPPKPELMKKINLEFQCELCSKVFDREPYLQAHRNLVHPNAVWTCSFVKCSKTFKFHNRLRLHKLTHVGDARKKPFVCGVCQKSFHVPDYLKMHEKSHAQDRKYKCVSCPKSFVTAKSLKAHVANHHQGGGKPFKCPVLNCGKSSASGSFLKGHLATQQTGKFKCNLCTKHITFKSLLYLQGHKRRVHSDDYPSQTKNSTNDKASNAVVFICSSKECSFQTVSEKEVAIHYSDQHGLPKVVLIPSRIGPTMKISKVVQSSSSLFCTNASSKVNDSRQQTYPNSLQV